MKTANTNTANAGTQVREVRAWYPRTCIQEDGTLTNATAEFVQASKLKISVHIVADAPIPTDTQVQRAIEHACYVYEEILAESEEGEDFNFYAEIWGEIGALVGYAYDTREYVYAMRDRYGCTVDTPVYTLKRKSDFRI